MPPPKKKSTPSVTPNISGDKQVTIGGNVIDSAVVIGDHNTVNQTFIQKVFNIFKSESESIEQRNRRIMLGHVENFWVKGILEKSLHGAILLDLGIKENPDVLNYPWAIKREANKEILPAGTSMLDIFQEIGMGRSLLILGAPGSGKTTMLLELTRQLIERVRQDVTDPIPLVFNLSSWTENLTLADWLARELNNIYSVPKKTAPTWVNENKMLILLDGLDEVKQENRGQCVDVINVFRIEHGMTNMAVCSRTQEYYELNKYLTFDGAIEIQPLTSNQVDEYFMRFGKGLMGVKQVLERDTALREMAETPLFLSIMTLAYRDMHSKDILVSENIDTQRKSLLDTYTARMFERPERSNNLQFKKQDVLHWLSWLAHSIALYNQNPYLLESMQPIWLGHNNQRGYNRIIVLFTSFTYGLMIGLLYMLFFGLGIGVISGLFFWLIFGLLFGLSGKLNSIQTVDSLAFDWQSARTALIGGLIFGFLLWSINPEVINLWVSLLFGVLGGLIPWIYSGLRVRQVDLTIRPGQRLSFSLRNFFLVALLYGSLFGAFLGLLFGWLTGTGFSNILFELSGEKIIWSLSTLFLSLAGGLLYGLIGGLLYGLRDYGGISIIQHYTLRFLMSRNNHIPWKLIP
ncbi:MAG: NACHT domain-containing protein, partial [Anaerolineales bacterium]|nr:NACHT domain-containing protein [Anaerolineales bacterium]